jgi:CheY-like chemotaxis protein
MIKKTIMIVDDNPDTQYILGLALKESGYNVVNMANGHDALVRVREGDIDLIISDILMPGMDGFQLCWKLKLDEKTRNVPFVFYSAYYTGKTDETFAMNLGAQRFFTKPTDPDEFVEKIRQVIHECENSKLPVPRFAYSNQDTFLKEYVERLKGSIERNILGMNEHKSMNVQHIQAKSDSSIDIEKKDTKQIETIPEIGHYEGLIISELSESPNGYTTNQVAKITGISRTTVIKYLSVLKERGKADYVIVGPSKLWFSTNIEKPSYSNP